MSRGNNSGSIAFFSRITVLDKKIGDVCDRLRKLSARDFSRAQKRRTDPNALPISKCRLIEAISEYSTSCDSAISLSERIRTIIASIKFNSSVGDYGRFSSLITSAELIPCGSTVIYSPNDKNPGNLPVKKYKHSLTGKENPLVTALGGSQGEWSRYLEDQNLSPQAQAFYREHHIELELALKELRFFDKLDTFYTPNRMETLTVIMPDGEEQALCVFDSNASQIQGGQWLFSAPSGLPNEGYVEHILTEMPRVVQAVSRKQDDASYSFDGMSEASQRFADSIHHFSGFTGRSREAPARMPLKKAYEKRSKSAMFTYRREIESLSAAPSKAVVASLKVDESKQLIMQEKADLVFLLGTAVDSRFVIFQNSRDVASVSAHYHCYAVKKDMLAQDGVRHPIPLFQASVKKSIFEGEVSGVQIKFEKMEWAAPCYRLTVPLHNISNARFVIAKALRELQDSALSKNPNVSFTYIVTHDGNELSFNIGFRKCIPQNGMPNQLAEKNNLQPPDNGCLEFAGINTMKSKCAFQKYLELYNRDPIAAKVLFLEMQTESLTIICPSPADVDSFESDALSILEDCVHKQENSFSL